MGRGRPDDRARARRPAPGRRRLPDSEIATALFLAEGTVRSYLPTAITELGVRNRIEAARVARGRAWL